MGAESQTIGSPLGTDISAVLIVAKNILSAANNQLIETTVHILWSFITVSVDRIYTTFTQISTGGY